MSFGDGSENVPAKYRRLIEREASFQSHFPQITAFLVKHEDDFLGLTLIPAREGGFLCILKKVGDDGSNQVMFCHGSEARDALFNAEGALANAKWRPEKPWSPTPKKLKK